MNRQLLINRLVARNTQPTTHNKAICINAANKVFCAYPGQQKAICWNAARAICFGGATQN